METLIRSRAARVGLACVLLAIGLWTFFPYMLHRVSSAAFVNAELMHVASPIAGRLTNDLPQKGEFIAAARTLTLVESPSPDRRQLTIYEQEYAVSKTRLELALAQMDAIAESDRRLAARLESYREAMLERLRRETEEASANLKACSARREELGKQHNRIESLAKTGYVSTQRMEEVQSAYATVTANCEAATARIDRLNSMSGAAKQGIFLQDGYNDTPYSEQQRDRLMLRKQDSEAEVLRESARLAQLEADIKRERERVERTSRYELTLPAGHVVWTITASPGSPVVEAQTIMDLASCQRRFVIVELPERDFEAVHPGDRATVRLLGSHAWIEGRVQQVLGSAARQDERLLAAQVPKPEGRRVTVEIALAADSLPTETGRYCDIGRMAEVRIDRSGGFLSSAADKLTRISRWLDLSDRVLMVADAGLEH